MFYWGTNLGDALRQFIKDRPNYLDMLERIDEEPVSPADLP